MPDSLMVRHVAVNHAHRKVLAGSSPALAVHFTPYQSKEEAHVSHFPMPCEMEGQHLTNALRYHNRKVQWHSEQVQALKKEHDYRKRSKRGARMPPIGYAAVWQGGRLVHFSGSMEEYARNHLRRKRA